MPSPEGEPMRHGEAQQAFAAWLRDRAAEGGPSFDKFCEAHAELAPELRKLHSLFQLAQAAGSSRSPGKSEERLAVNRRSYKNTMNFSISNSCHHSQTAEAETTSPMDSPTRIDRRRFLFTTAGLSLALPQVGFAADADKSPGRSPVVDTHVHCFAGKDNARFPYHPRAPYRPDASATPQHLLRCMDEAGVGFAVIVHPEPYQDDHRYLEYCFEVGKSRFKGTCLFFADQPESLAKMPDLVKRLPIVAARIHAYAPDRLPPFEKPALRELWKIAGAHGLAVQLHFEPRYAPGFEPLIKEFSDVKVVIDHLGRPFQGTPDEHEVVVRWSRFKNTVMKLSAIPSPTTYPHRDLGPIIKRLAQEFGPDRMIYGGGFSSEATGTTYRAAREQARSQVSFLSATDQAKVFGENAARLFGFKQD